MASPTTRTLTRSRLSALSSAVIVLAGLTLFFVLLRHYWPPDRGKAFPSGEIVVGVDASFPPFALDDGESLTGLDIELATAIAQELDVKIRFVNIGFYSLYDALLSGKADVLISALRVDPARTDDVRYTKPYFDNGLVLVAAGESPSPVIDPPATNGVAYEYASSADAQIRAWEEDGKDISRLPYELPEYALDALRFGIADAALVDATTLHLYQSAHSEWKAEYEFVTHEPYASALKYDRIDAWKLVDRALATLKERGELARIIVRWF